MRRGIQRPNKAVRLGWKTAQGGMTNRGRLMRERSYKPDIAKSARGQKLARPPQPTRQKANRGRSRGINWTKGGKEARRKRVGQLGHKPYYSRPGTYQSPFGSEPEIGLRERLRERRVPTSREDNPQIRARQAKFDEVARKRELGEMFSMDIYGLAHDRYKWAELRRDFGDAKNELYEKLVHSGYPRNLAEKNDLIGLIIRAERLLGQ